MSREFTFTVYQNRRDHEDTYTIVKTENGWHVSHIAINGETKPNGENALFMNLNQDSISYPKQLGSFLEWLWEEANNNRLTDDEIQTKIQELADWISITERAEPKWIGWNA